MADLVNSAEAAEDQQQPVRGRPFPKGVSGNPSGVRVRHRTLFDEIAVELGELTAIEHEQLNLAVDALLTSKRTKDPNQKARCANTANGILEKLKEKRAPLPPRRSYGRRAPEQPAALDDYAARHAKADA